MSDYPVGYGKPPVHTQFKPRNNANPKGRPRRKPEVVFEVINDVSNSKTQYFERGRTKKATWIELALRKRIRLALTGNLRSIDALLKQLIHAQRVGDTGNQRLFIRDWLPDFPGQTAEQKTRQFAAQRAEDSAERKESEVTPPDDSS